MSFLSNSKFCDFVDCMYPIELEIKYTIDTARLDSYIRVTHRNGQ